MSCSCSQCGNNRESPEGATFDAEQIKQAVRERYARVAKEGSRRGLVQKESCCSAEAMLPPGKDWAKIVGYAEDIDAMPESVTESFAGCGNPIALASLKPGEVVLDLGSGAGLDVFLAAQRVGEQGRAIGLDMTPEMLQKARDNASKLALKNVEFRFGEIENMPVEDRSIDVIISNCVINLAPDKKKVFQEAYRVLRAGGRMMISDIVVDGELPPEIRADLSAWAGCVAGALPEAEYLDIIRQAGFVAVKVVSKASMGPISSDKIEAYKPAG